MPADVMDDGGVSRFTLGLLSLTSPRSIVVDIHIESRDRGDTCACMSVSCDEFQ